MRSFDVINHVIEGPHQIIVGRFVQPHPAGRERPLYDANQTRTFISGFACDASFWRSAVSSNDFDVTNEVTKKVLDGTLRFYKLPRLADYITADEFNNGYSFVRGPECIPTTDTQPLKFSSQSDVAKLTSSLTKNSKFWFRVLLDAQLIEIDFLTSQSDENKLLSRVNETLMSGELCAYRVPYTPPTPHTNSETVDTNNTPGNRQTNLGPESDGKPESEDSEIKKITTGRTSSKNLREKLAMEEVKSNPAGFTPPRMPKMSDTKNGLKHEDGWVKKTQNVNGVEIHYVENINTKVVTDFKFKD